MTVPSNSPVFLPGEFHGQRSLAGYSPLGHKESDTTELLTHTHTLGSDTNSNVSDGGGFPFQQAILGTPARYPTNQLNFDTVSTVSPSVSHEVMGPDAMILVF